MDLSGVKVGDKVVVRHCNGIRERLEHTVVTKVTKTQVTVENGTRFMMNGNKLGEANKYRGWFTFLYTEEEWNK